MSSSRYIPLAERRARRRLDRLVSAKRLAKWVQSFRTWAINTPILGTTLLDDRFARSYCVERMIAGSRAVAHMEEQLWRP